jgi:cytochrome c556
MNTKRFPIIAGIAIVAIAIAAFLVLRRAPEAEGSLVGGPVIAGLADKLNDVSTVRFVKAGETTLLTLQREGEGWAVVERDGYPADAAKVRLALINLGETKVLEPKTANPERYAQLGVQDVDAADATGTRVELSGEGIDSKLVVGNPVAQGGEGTYVRRVGEAASLLATGNLVPDPEIGQWLKREITDIPSSRIREIELRQGEARPLRVFKNAPEDANFVVADIPRGREVQSDVVANGLGSMLAGLTLEDVAKADGAPSSDLVQHDAVYRLFDGTVITMQGWQETDGADGNPGKAYATFAASLDEDQARTAIVADVEREQATAAAEASAPVDSGAVPGEATVDADASASSEQPPATSDAGAGAAADGDADPAVAEAKVDVEAETDKRLADLRKEVDAMNARLGGWRFELPAYKFANVDKTLENMLKPRE